MRKERLEPAFPMYASEADRHYVEEGMSLLDYFAAKAMHAMMANPQCYYDITNKKNLTENKTQAQICSEEAYEMAREMLNARVKAQLTTNNCAEKTL